MVVHIISVLKKRRAWIFCAQWHPFGSGPLGSFIGSQIGSAIGGLKDAGEALRDFNLVDYVYEAIPEGATVIVLQADEKGSDALTKKLNEYDVTISRVSVPELIKGIELLEKEKESDWTAWPKQYDTACSNCRQLTDIIHSSLTALRLLFFIIVCAPERNFYWLSAIEQFA